MRCVHQYTEVLLMTSSAGINACTGRRWILHRSRMAAHVRAGFFSVLLVAASRLQASQAGFTCSGGYTSCPDKNLQVGGGGAVEDRAAL